MAGSGKIALPTQSSHVHTFNKDSQTKMGQFNASVFKNWAKKAAPKYTEKKMNLRMAMAEFVAIDQLPTDTNTLIQNQTAALTDAVINNSSFGVNTAFGNCNFIQGTANVCAQVAGSILAASFLYGMVPNASESSLGANAISPGFNTGEALLGEVFMTGFLCFVVHMCVADPRNKTISPMAPLAIGFAVFLAHAVLIPVDGCSINPDRSLGPAILSCNWGNFWVFVVGPFVGSLFSVFFWLLVSLAWDIEAETVTPAPASPGELPGVTSDIKYSGYRA
ncbi:hypothetical protein Ndes2437B_g00970 [Nannochloris sp. 'desiccata']